MTFITAAEAAKLQKHLNLLLQVIYLKKLIDILRTLLN